MTIIGVEHIQFADPDLSASVDRFTRSGYGLDFQQTDFNSAPRSFFRDAVKHMAYLHRGASRVEVITSPASAPRARYVPLARGIAARFCDGCPTIVDGVVAPAHHLARSMAWWQVLGFQPQGDCAVAFPVNALSMRLMIRLDRTAPLEVAAPMADNIGCTAISLITSDLASDRGALSEAGYEVSEATWFRINTRPVTVCFVTGPSGELVELVEFGGR